jgi:hypothetical protein
MDVQLVIVAVAAGIAAVYSARRVFLQFQRPDDEPIGCQSCLAHRIDLPRSERKEDGT